jgi:hypothetical protein
MLKMSENKELRNCVDFREVKNRVLKKIAF